MARCNWVATVTVERRIGGTGDAPSLRRIVASDLRLRGSRPGSCIGAKSAIARELAGRDAEVKAHVLAVAERDRAILLAELDAATGPAAS